MNQLRGSLAHVASSGFGTEDQERSDAMCREAWLNEGVLVVRADTVDNVTDIERQVLRKVGNRLYGKPNGVG